MRYLQNIKDFMLVFSSINDLRIAGKRIQILQVVQMIQYYIKLRV